MKRFCGFVFLLLFFLAHHAFAQIRVEPDPRAAEYTQRGRSAYSWTELAEISLWASGDTAISANMEKIRAAANELRSSPDFPASERERAEYVLQFLYKKFLKTYSLNQTRIDTLLSGGRYNCVSSAVLYMILAKSIGLTVTGVVTRDHAFAVVQIGGDSIDVETTNAWGFDPGSRKDFHDQFGTVTGFAYVPAHNYRDRAAISQIELVSLIFHNRIADLESRNRFAEAVPLAIDRAVLLGVNSPGANSYSSNAALESLFGDPGKDMMDRIFNYGGSLLRAGKEEDCIAWANLVRPLYPADIRWQEFILAAVNNRCVKLINAGQYSAARELINTQKPFMNAADCLKLESMIIDMELVSDAGKIKTVDDGNRILNAIEQARANKQLENARASELIVFTVQKTASVLSAAPARDWLAAIRYIEAAIARFGSISGFNRSELDRALQVYRDNRASDIHNRFAAAYNRRNYDEATRIVNEGLAEFPNNRTLLADKQLLDRL